MKKKESEKIENPPVIEARQVNIIRHYTTVPFHFREGPISVTGRESLRLKSDGRVRQSLT